MRGDEARVVEAFCNHLQIDGWDVQREVKLVDVMATRGSQTLYAEAMGRTSSIGLDVDTLYGQLPRRVPARPHSPFLSRGARRGRRGRSQGSGVGSHQARRPHVGGLRTGQCAIGVVALALDRPRGDVPHRRVWAEQQRRWQLRICQLVRH